jgi:hypothetical protein
MKFLLTVYLPGVLAGIASLAFLIYNGDWQWLFSTLIFWILLSGLGIAVGFHRIYSHRCYTNLAPWLVSRCAVARAGWVAANVERVGHVCPQATAMPGWATVVAFATDAGSLRRVVPHLSHSPSLR